MNDWNGSHMQCSHSFGDIHHYIDDDVFSETHLFVSQSKFYNFGHGFYNDGTYFDKIQEQ